MAKRRTLDKLREMLDYKVFFRSNLNEDHCSSDEG